jgi:hypothetical protein
VDLKKLEADLRELEARYKEWKAPIISFVDETANKLGQNGYTKEDRKREIQSFYKQQYAIYNPRLAIRPLLNNVFAAYVEVSADEREAIRNIFSHFSFANLLGYIVECAECLETPEDDDAFHLALIAASIENYAFDFRDTDMILAELAIAAVHAGIDMEPHCTAIAELCSDAWGKGGGGMKEQLATFHLYAPTAVRLVPYDWIRGVELEDEA